MAVLHGNAYADVVCVVTAGCCVVPLSVMLTLSLVLLLQHNVLHRIIFHSHIMIIILLISRYCYIDYNIQTLHEKNVS